MRLGIKNNKGKEFIAIKLPIYDLATLGAGFYIGYQEGKGINPGVTVEYLTKYAPTALSVVGTPLKIKAGDIISKVYRNVMINKLYPTIDHPPINKLYPPPIDPLIEQKEKDEAERAINSITIKLDVPIEQEEKDKIERAINSITLKIRDTEYVRPTKKRTAITALETIIGYAAGRLYSQVG